MPLLKLGGCQFCHVLAVVVREVHHMQLLVEHRLCEVMVLAARKLCHILVLVGRRKCHMLGVPDHESCHMLVLKRSNCWNSTYPARLALSLAPVVSPLASALVSWQHVALVIV